MPKGVEQPFVSACTYCRHPVEVPDGGEGSKLVCPLCGYEFKAKRPAAPPASPAPPPVVAPSGPGAPATEVRPAAGPTPAARPGPNSGLTPAARPETVPSLTDWGGPEPDDDSDPLAGPWFPPAGVASVLLAGLALIVSVADGTAVLTRPLAGVGLVVGGVALGLYWGSRGVAACGTGAGLSAVVFLLALFAPSVLGPGYESSRQKSTYDPEAVRVVRLNPRPGTPSAAPAGPDGSADADSTAVEQGPIRVQVVSATISGGVGESRSRGGKKDGVLHSPTPPLPNSSTPRLLQVVIRLRHLGHGGPVPVHKWGGSPDVPAAGAEEWRSGGVEESRSEERKVTLLHSSTPPLLHSSAPDGGDLGPGQTLDVPLWFEPPAGPGPLRLTLPAAAWGGPGVVRFVVPAAMIVVRDAPADGPAPGPKPLAPFAPGGRR